MFLICKTLQFLYLVPKTVQIQPLQINSNLKKPLNFKFKKSPLESINLNLKNPLNFKYTKKSVRSKIL